MGHGWASLYERLTWLTLAATAARYMKSSSGMVCPATTFTTSDTCTTIHALQFRHHVSSYYIHHIRYMYHVTGYRMPALCS